MEVQARDDLLREGEDALAATDWETARGCFERVLEQEEDPDALTGLSKLAMLEREYERAIASVPVLTPTRRRASCAAWG